MEKSNKLKIYHLLHSVISEQFKQIYKHLHNTIILLHESFLKNKKSYSTVCLKKIEINFQLKSIGELTKQGVEESVFGIS